MNPYLDEELQVLAEQVRRFAAGRVAPGFLERASIPRRRGTSPRCRELDRGAGHLRRRRDPAPSGDAVAMHAVPSRKD